MNNRTIQLNKMCLSAMLIAIGWILPFFTGQIPQIGNMLCPMHFPVFLAGFILGPWYGMLIGFTIPFTRSLLFGMPVLYPTAVAMMLELAAYGLISGFLFRLLQNRTKLHDLTSLIISLLTAMLLGRAVWGLARAFCGLFPNTTFTWAAFLSGAFITAWPGILLQLLVIPSLLMALDRANLLTQFMKFEWKKTYDRVDSISKEEM